MGMMDAIKKMIGKGPKEGAAPVAPSAGVEAPAGMPFAPEGMKPMPGTTLPSTPETAGTPSILSPEGAAAKPVEQPVPLSPSGEMKG